MLFPNVLSFVGEETSLLADTMRQGEGGLFVYTCFIDVVTAFVYDVLEFVLGRFPFNGEHQ